MTLTEMTRPPIVRDNMSGQSSSAPLSKIPFSKLDVAATNPLIKSLLLKYTGFNKYKNLLLFLGTTGIFANFCLFNLLFSLPEGHAIKPNPPGPLYWFNNGPLAIVMRLHLWSVLRKYSAHFLPEPGMLKKPIMKRDKRKTMHDMGIANNI